tara:strand:- start:366 stop:1874 length:1509 start_codon:yes stop_codon:yes gene_type:complete
MSKLGIKPIHLLSIIFLSFLLFRGRLGSDDIEVYNFVKHFIYSDLSLREFLANITKFQDLNIEQDMQPISLSTWSHRFIWIIQTFIITKIIYFFGIFFEFDKLFISQYFSGYILTIYSCLAYLITFLYLNKKNSLNYSFFLSSIIFFGTGLISFFTGSYIESLILLLFVIREISKDLKIKFFLDSLIILIKPYYFIYIIFLYLHEDKKLFKNIKIFFFLLLIYFAAKSLINSVSSVNNVNIFLSFNPNFDFQSILKNLYNFYFSFGVGIFFSSTIIIILVIFGFSKETFLKFAGMFLLSIFLSMWEGFHGYAPGGRYFLPIIVTFLPEINLGFNQIINNITKLKFSILFNTILVLLLLNLPVLEYRNTNLTSYLNSSVYKNNNPNFIVIENNSIKLLNTPIQNIFYNHIIFSNRVLFNKIFDIDNFYIEELEIKQSSIYPMTGIARLIFISNNNIDIYSKKIKKFSDSIKVLLIIIYTGLVSILLWFIIYCHFNIKIINKKK